MVRITRIRAVVALLVLGLLLFGFGVWVLLHPASIWVQPWRATVSEVRNDVIFGPYPVEDDFQVLKDRGVTTIISLLNPAVPYEKVLLAEERERAARYGMEIRNFPMGSILGQKFGEDYHVNSRAAAEAALQAPGTAYIHCYLGINRAKNVQNYLDTLAPTTNYAGVGGSLEDVEAHERARLAYGEGDHQGVVDAVAGMQLPSVQALRMAGWSQFRMGRMPEARGYFERILAEVPGDDDATTGLGYCALREGALADAGRHFAEVLARTGGDAAALEGMGYVQMRQGDRARARAMFEKALVANPENEETRAALARLEAEGEVVAESL